MIDGMLPNRGDWYRPDQDHGSSYHDTDTPRHLKLNPALTALGFCITTPAFQGMAEFDISKRAYDKPGPWTAMLATKPPCRRVEISFVDSGFSAVHLSYLVETASDKDVLLLGDILAVLAECQNRAETGVDGADSDADPISRAWGQIAPVKDAYMEADPFMRDLWRPALEMITDNVSIKVDVRQS